MNQNIYFEDKQFKGAGSVWPFLKRLFKYSLRYPKWFIGFTAGIVLVGLTDALWPVIWMHFLDDVIVPMVLNYEEFRLQGKAFEIETAPLWKYFGLFFGNGVLQVIGVYYFIVLAGRLQEHVLYDLRQEMFNKLQNLQHSFYDKSAMGWLLSRLTSDTDRVAELISWGFLELLWGFTMIMACLGIMFFYSWKLAFIVMLSLPVLFIVSMRLRKLILKYSRRSRKINSEITASYSEHINGVAVNKSTAQEERVSEDFNRLSLQMRKTTFKSTFYTAMYMPIVIFIGALTAIFVINAGGRMAIATPIGITVGTLAAFFGYATRIFEPIMDITRFYANAQNSLSAGERIFGLIDEEVLIKDQEGATDYKNIKGAIEFKNVTFQYVEDKPILKNFNLKINAGQSIALVGATGEGKTTIANLIGRFYDPVEGTIFIDDEDFKTKTMRSLRAQMGIVLQTSHLFKGTIKENLIYGKQDANDEELKAALKAVNAERFLERLNEDVGENGDNLSLGEKQLISFARALIAKPSILIMDEATSSVDTLTEKNIQKGVEELIQNQTSVIIAHRLSTIKNCDRILVIQKGAVIEDGSHKELIQLKGHYYKLYTKQLTELDEQKIVSEV